jgi:hypothetical protein
MKLKFLALPLVVVLSVIGLIQGSAAAATGYYGSNIGTDHWWCGVLGDMENRPGTSTPYPQSECVNQSNGSSTGRQKDALSYLAGRCKGGTDSNCLKAELIKAMSAMLSGSGGNDFELQHVGASFIVNTMVGKNNGRKIYPGGAGGAVFDDWVSRLGNPGVTLRVAMYPFKLNTAFDPYTNDIVQYSEDAVVTKTSLVISYNGNPTYAIKLDCGNPVGNLSPLPPPSIPPVVTCGNGIVVDPQKPEVGDSVTVTVTINFTPGSAPPSPSGQSINVSGMGNVGAQTPIKSGNSYTIKSNSFPITATGHYAVSWTMKVNDVSPTPNPICNADLSVPGDSFDVYNYPFLEVEAGDVAAGARFATSVGAACGASRANAGIVSWNKGAPGYKGAGGQYGVTARSFIQDFISNKGNPGTNGGSATSLSFAGVDESPAINSVDPPVGRFGGFFHKGPCVDYWSKKPTPGKPLTTDPTNTRLQDLASDTYVHSGDLTIIGSDVPDKRHLTIYVEGRVKIVGPIRYDGSSNPTWGSLADIPTFKLIVHGSMFIDSNVRQLDGNYVAVPDTGYDTSTSPNSYTAPAAGTILTCTNGFTGLALAVPMIDPCSKQLVVNGSFAANQIFFLRTHGTMRSEEPAELFRFSPEIWLAPSGEGLLDPAYKSIIGLPPVL